MNKKTLAVLIMAVVVVVVVAVVGFTGGNPNAVMDCADCEGVGCEVCANAGTVPADSPYYSTWMALLAPVIAIALALVTKEV